MRDYSNLCVSPQPEAVFKEVVVIGNGPAGLAASYMLAGRWPHVRPGPGSTLLDPMLKARLESAADACLFNHDLGFLAQDLEGRSRSPVATLIDALMHPGADQGADEVPLLDWRMHKAIDHVVIGKGPPGGSWQAMDGNILTLSLSSWMELPGFRYKDWEKEKGLGEEGPRRVRVKHVAQYYTDYIHKHRLWKYQKRGEVKSIRFCDEDCEVHKGPIWRVEGVDWQHRPFSYICRKLILATGTTDLANRLGAPGEDQPWVHHDLRQFEDALHKLPSSVHPADSGEVLVVGAGLSAADAILAARFHNLRVTHVFRMSSVSMERMLPEAMYPEYHKVNQMMVTGGAGYPGYTALPGYTVQEFSRHTSETRLVSPEGKSATVPTQMAAVLLGSRPRLAFLPPEFDSGRSLGVVTGKDIDCRSNPLEVDIWTHELVKAPHGLYAVGPLSGDNFVRFIVGGVVAAVAHIVTSRSPR